MLRLFCLLQVAFVCTSNAQDITAMPEILYRSNYHLPENVQAVYTIDYSIQLHERVMPDSTVFTDTLLSKSMERNYTFDEAGRLLILATDSFDSNGRIVLNKKTRCYYDQGGLTGVTNMEGDKITDSVCIRYNRHRQVAEQVYFDKKGRKLNRVQYFYRGGNVFNIKLRDENDLLVNFIRFECDARGNLREKELKSSEMQYLSSLKYSYDTLGNGNIQINEYDYRGTKVTGMRGRVLDTKGRLIELSVADSNKRIIESRTLGYNDKDLLVSELVFTMYKYDYTYSYEYDDNGYWKTKRMFEQDRPVRKIHRVIEYFETTANSN